MDSASLTMNLSGPVAAVGNITGTLTITGAPYPLGGATTTYSGSVQGSYLATQ